MGNSTRLNNFTNKRILYIGKAFFDYHIEIKSMIMEKGAKVDFFPTEKYTFLYSLFKLCGSHFFRFYNAQYERKILTRISGIKYDYILMIQGHQFSHDFYMKLKLFNPDAKMIMYHWDSIATHNYLEFIRYFDRVLSFDMKDCYHQKDIKYLPLFYTKKYEILNEIIEHEAEKPIDILFIGSLAKYHRYSNLKKIKKICDEAGLIFHCHLYVSRVQFIQFLLRGKLLNSIINFKKLSSNEIVSLMKQSKSILDISNNYQNGLTMRTFEVLGAGIKLITSNKNIQSQPFYDENFISIIDFNNFKLDINFLNNTKAEMRKNWMLNYSLDQWIDNVFNF